MLTKEDAYVKIVVGSGPVGLRRGAQKRQDADDADEAEDAEELLSDDIAHATSRDLC